MTITVIFYLSSKTKLNILLTAVFYPLMLLLITFPSPESLYQTLKLCKAQWWAGAWKTFYVLQVFQCINSVFPASPNLGKPWIRSAYWAVWGKKIYITPESQSLSWWNTNIHWGSQTIEETNCLVLLTEVWASTQKKQDHLVETSIPNMAIFQMHKTCGARKLVQQKLIFPRGQLMAQTQTEAPFLKVHFRRH